MSETIVIVTQNKPFKERFQGVDVVIDYDTAKMFRSYRDDGIKVISGWWPECVNFYPPLFIKVVDVSDYIQHGQGD